MKLFSSKKARRACAVNVSASFIQTEALEARRLFAAAAAVPLGINFNDEALWSENFDTGVAEAKALGIGAVRLWLDVRNYADRYKAYDPDPGSGVTTYTRSNGSAVEVTNPQSRVLKRIFELKRAGFNVLVVVQRADGVVPTSASEVTGLYTHLMNTTETAGGGMKLKDAIDRWEIGNEPDLAPYWQDSAADKTAGLKSYVDKLLLPAASVLHSGPKADWETVVSAGVSFSVNHLKTIVNYAIAQGKGDAIDMIGYHPYGTLSQQKDRAPLAKAYGDSVGKPVLATEWTVRGFDVNGSQNAAWAAANDGTYRTYHKPNFATSYYFALVDNFAARAGLARPGSVLEHTSTNGVTTQSTPAQKTVFYKSPLRKKDPFYSMYSSWQYGNVSGTVFEDADGNGTQHGSEAGVAGRIVYLDTDGNGVKASDEPSAVTNAAGAFSLKYSVGQISPGTYTLRQVLPSGATQTTAAKSIAVSNLNNETGVKLGVKSGTVTPPVVTTGKITGVAFNDTDGNGVRDTGEATLGGRAIFIDANNNNTRDAGELFATTDSAGTYTIDYDTAATPAGTYSLKQALPANWEQTTPARSATLAPDSSVTIVFGSRPVVVTPPVATGSIAGYLWGDINGDGLRDASESPVGSRVAFLDADSDGVFDTGEKSVTTDSAGAFKFDNLPAGTYRVRRVLPNGYRITAPAGGFATVTLAAGQNVTGVGIGSTDRALVSGIVFDDADKNGVKAASEAGLAGAVVFVDANKNNAFDAGEKSVTTDSVGNWQFTDLVAGTHVLRLASVQGRVQTLPTANGSLSLTVKTAQIVGSLKFGSAIVVTPPVTTGKVSGTVFNDLDADRVLDAGESGVAGRTVWLDLDGDLLFDLNEPNVQSTANGAWTINYDTKNTPAGVYALRQVLPSGYEATTPAVQCAVAGGRADAGVLVGSRLIPPTDAGKITGYIFGDSNGNGIVDDAEQIGGSRQIFLDTNDNGKLDAGEKALFSAANGTFSFDNLAAGNYVVRRVAASGYRFTGGGDDGARRVTLAAGQTVTDQAIGSTDRALLAGNVFNDFDQNGVRDADETGAPGWRVFIDADADGLFDDGEKNVLTNADGKWAFTDLLAGTYAVRIEGQNGYGLTANAAGFNVTVAKASVNTGKLFGVSQIVIPPPVTPLEAAVAAGWQRAAEQFGKTVSYLGNDPGKFVDYTGVDGNWKVVGPRSWTSGFLAGSFWQLYDHTNDAAWKADAIAWTKTIAPAATLESGDNGARFMPSYLPLYESSQDPVDRAVLLQAAAAKDATWNAAVGAYETTWHHSTSGNPDANFAVLLDMTNDLDLVLWAAQQTGDTAPAARATKHLETVIANLVRADGSTAQFGLFDKASGQFQGNETYQGAAGDSTWARGQAWAIKSFTDVAARTGRADFITAAAKVANYFVDNLPADSVPFWDFTRAGTAGAPKDSSAAAIAASGLLKLSTVVTDPAQAAKFKISAEAILTALLSPAYLAPTSAPAGLVQHAAGNVPNNPSANDVSLIYGDYNLLEAMSRWETLQG